MANNKDIAFKLEIDGVEQSIKSVKDLKEAIKVLQEEAENADLGSDNYKNAIEQIESLSDKLKEVTQTEKQAAQAMENMANAEKEATKETQDLRKQFEVLEDELFLLAGQGKQNTKEFKDLSSEAAKLNAKIDQVNQTIGTGSSGVDKLSGSFGMLSEGFTSMNFDKVKAGFKGIGQAMSAVPLMLLVTGITMLAEKFELFKIIGEAIEKLFYAITDAMGLTSKAAEEQTASIIAGMQQQQDAINGRYDKEIKLSKAAGEDTILMEIEKSKAVEASAFNQLNTLSALGRKKKKFNEEEQKQYDDLQKALYDAQLNRQVLETTLEKKKQDEQKANNEKELADKIAADAKAAERAKAAAEKRKADRAAQLADDMKYMQQIEAAKIKSIEDEDQRLAIQATLNKQRRDTEINNSKASDSVRIDALRLSAKTFQDEMQKIYDDKIAREDKAETDRLAAIGAMQDAQMKSYTEKANQKYLEDQERIKKEKEGYAELEKEKYNLAKQGIEGVQALSDMYFLFRSQNAQKGSKEEAELAKKAFNVNKALQLATATINGVQAVQGAFATATASPITTVFPAYPFIQAGLAGVLSAANIAKIAASKFESASSGGGGGSVSAPSVPSIPAPPISTASNNTNQSTLFDESGQNLGFKPKQQINVTATVGVDEIANKTNRVSVLEQQSTF
jgi:hypothetical protein